LDYKYIIIAALSQEFTLFSAPSRENKNRRTPDSQASLNVTDGIADEVRTCQIEAQFAGRSQKQTGARFVTVAILVGTMGTEEHSIDPSAPASDFLCHTAIDFLYRFLFYQPPANSRLITDNDDCPVTLCQEPQRLEDTRQEGELFPSFYMVWTVDVDDSIAVKEHRGSH